MKKPTAVAVSIAATAVATAAVSALIAWIAWPTKDPKADLGDLPTWISAVMAVLAFAGLVVTAIYAARIYRIESERDEETAKERRARDDAERRAQADKVATWFVHEGIRGGRFGNYFGAYLRNASDLPIYDVQVRFFYAHSPQEGSPWVAIERGRGEEELRVVAPGEETYVQMPHDVGSDVRPIRASDWVTGIDFRDTAGVRWHRDPYGKLTELPGS